MLEALAGVIKIFNNQKAKMACLTNSWLSHGGPELLAKAKISR